MKRQMYGTCPIVSIKSLQNMKVHAFISHNARNTVLYTFVLCPLYLPRRRRRPCCLGYYHPTRSVGVLAFMLLSSSMPFYGKTRNQVLKKIVRGKFHYSSRRWRTVSKEAMDFVGTLLQSNPAERPSAEEAMALPWMAQRLEQEEINIKADVDMMDSIQGSIQAFAGYGVLKKLALMVVAYRSTADEIGFLRKMFSRFDSLHNGEISEEEFSQALAVYNYQPNEIHELYRGIDIDGTGSVHYIEFLAATLEALGRIDEERLAEAFDRIDSDDSGFISIQDCKNSCVPVLVSTVGFKSLLTTLSHCSESSCCSIGLI